MVEWSCNEERRHNPLRIALYTQFVPRHQRARVYTRTRHTSPRARERLTGTIGPDITNKTPEKTPQ